MASEFIGRDEFERRLGSFTGYVDHTISQLKTFVVNEVKASESRTQKKIEAVQTSLQESLQAFRERHDVEIAQVHTEIGQIREILLWIAQRLPPEPLGPPPAQFVQHDK
jgi:5-formyltetrahydrofolate cyclo-ligase